jgi:hypothetical protein
VVPSSNTVCFFPPAFVPAESDSSFQSGVVLTAITAVVDWISAFRAMYRPCCRILLRRLSSASSTCNVFHYIFVISSFPNAFVRDALSSL